MYCLAVMLSVPTHFFCVSVSPVRGKFKGTRENMKLIFLVFCVSLTLYHFD